MSTEQKPRMRMALRADVRLACDEKRKPGRPAGALGRLTKESVEHAKSTGEMPHHFLLRVSRGEVIEHKVLNPVTGEVSTTYLIPTFQERVGAAKDCTPYFVPKLAAVEVLGNLSDEELDEIIGSSARQAGFSLGPAGEGATGGDEDGGEDSPEDSWI